MIIDSHCHIWEYKDTKKAYSYVSNTQDLINILNTHWVQKAICSPEPHWGLSFDENNTSHEETAAINNIPYGQDNISLLKLKKAYDISNILLPFRIIDTRKKIKEQIKLAEQQLKKDPLYGVKFHCQTLDVNIADIDNPTIMPFLKDAKLPVLLHTWIRKDKWLASHVLDAVEKHAEINFSIAHMGRFEKKFWDRYDKNWMPWNLFIDTSPFYAICNLSASYKDKERLERILDINYKNTEDCFKMFVEKYKENLMRGSDYPYISYPEYQWSYKENIDLLNTLDEETKWKISYRNTLKFLWNNIV